MLAFCNAVDCLLQRAVLSSSHISCRIPVGPKKLKYSWMMAKAAWWRLWSLGASASASYNFISGVGRVAGWKKDASLKVLELLLVVVDIREEFGVKIQFGWIGVRSVVVYRAACV